MQISKIIIGPSHAIDSERGKKNSITMVLTWAQQEKDQSEVSFPFVMSGDSVMIGCIAKSQRKWSAGSNKHHMGTGSSGLPLRVYVSN